MMSDKKREFGNVKIFARRNPHMTERNPKSPKITSERDPLADISTIDREVRIILELPGANKEDIQVNANENVVEIKTIDSIRKH